jgi:tetratricopeptide (TPR) repeat protein
LDGNSADAHAALGGFLLFHDWNWQEAEREFEKTVRLNANFSGAYQWYSDCLSAQGRLSAALEKARRAVRLDPFSVTAHWTVMLNLYYMRRYDETIEEGRKTQALEPNWTRSFMALAYEEKRDYHEAISLIPGSPDLSMGDSVIPFATATLAHIYDKAGMKNAALQQLAKLTEMSKRRFVQSYFFAVAYAGLGDYDEAFKSLDKGYDERPSDMTSVKVDPRLDPLRSDARYHRLLLRMGLPD